MRWIKKLLIIFLILAGLLGLGILYLNMIFLPYQAKNILTAKAKEVLKRDVEIKSLKFRLTKGLVLSRIRIAEKDNKNETFLSADEIRVGVVLPDFFRTGQIYISSITLTDPVVNLKRLDENRWNFSDILSSGNKESRDKTPAKTKAKKSPVILGGFRVERGRIVISDSKNSETVADLNATVHLSILHDVDFEINFTVPPDHSQVDATGKYSAGTKELTAALHATKFEPPKFIYLSGVPLYVAFDRWFIDSADANIKVKDGIFVISGAIRSDVDLLTKTQLPVRVKTTVSGRHLTYRKKGSDFEVEGDFNGAGTTVRVGDNQTYAGNLSGKNFRFKRSSEHFSMTGDLTLPNADLAFNGQSVTGALDAKKVIFDLNGKKLKIAGLGHAANLAFKDALGNLRADGGSGEIEIRRDDQILSFDLPMIFAEKLDGSFLDNKISGRINGQRIHIGFSDKGLQAMGHFTTSGGEIKTSNGFVLSGQPQFDLSLKQEAYENAKLYFKGNVLLTGENLAGLPKFGKAQNLTGSVSFENDRLKTAQLTFVLGKTPLAVSGSLENFKAPRLDIAVVSQTLEIDEAKKFFADKLKELQTDMTGTAQNLKVEYKGPAVTPEKAQINVSAFIQSATLTNARLKEPVKAVNGQIEYSSDHLGWENLNFLYQNEYYTANGFLRHFASPDLETTLSTKDFSLSLKGSRDSDTFSLSSLNGKYHNSTFDLRGRLDLNHDSSQADLKGSIDLHLEDMSRFPGMKNIDPALIPKGVVLLDGHFSVTDWDWQNISFDTAILSQLIEFRGLQFRDITGNFKTLGNEPQIISLKGMFYKGLLSVDIKPSGELGKAPCETQMELSGLDLSQLQNSFPHLRNKELAGFMSANAKFSGLLTNPKSWTGDGAAVVNDGKLLEFEVLKGIWKVLFGSLIVDDYKKITFTQAKASCKIKDGFLSTDDLTVKSSPADLTARGRLGFDGSLNFDMIAHVREAPITKANPVQAVPTTILSQVAKNVVGIRLTGTLNKPQIKYKILPLKMLEKTTTSIFQGLSGMLEDVLN